MSEQSMSLRLGLADAEGGPGGPSLPGGAHAFGQKESLVHRLKNILALYPEGVGVLYELLQNADDARARRCACCSMRTRTARPAC